MEKTSSDPLQYKKETPERGSFFINIFTGYELINILISMSHIVSHTLVDVIESIGFTYTNSNQYTSRPGYILKADNLYANKRFYYNTSIVLEIMESGTLFFAIRAYNSINDKHEDITRLIFPGIYQYLYQDRPDVTEAHLMRHRLPASVKYSL